MLKRPVKIAITVIIAVLIAGAAAAGFLYFNAGNVAEVAVTQATGNSEVGKLAGKIMDGTDVSDEEIRQATGLDEKTYKAVKKAAKSVGVDLNDSEQLRSIVMANLGKQDELEALAQKVESGALSVEQAAKQLEENFKIPEAN